MGTDKADFLRTKPGFPMYYDKNFNYMRDRDFWLKMLLGMALGCYIKNKY